MFVILVWVWIGNTAVYAQDSSWQLVKSADGIKVFSRENSKTKLDEVLVTAEANASASSLVSVVRDASNHHNWIYLCKLGKVIRLINPKEWVYYSEAHAPWPFENRDVVTKVNLVRDSATGTVFINSHTFHDSIPVKPDYVRIHYAWSQWAFTQEKNGITKIRLKLSVDLGGNVPKWLMRLTASTGPYHTVKNLIVQVRRPKYRKASSARVSAP